GYKYNIYEMSKSDPRRKVSILNNQKSILHPRSLYPPYSFVFLNNMDRRRQVTFYLIILGM
ncbi:MAG: hypothetical protein ACRD8Z_18265, partial [Nitrososphaeraceae archaeon]